jgi:hypothetical protein
MGNLMTVEVDSWWLPDTTGTAYHRDHVKTAIIPLRADPQHRRLTYLHNAGQFDLEGRDFEGVFATEPGLSLVPFRISSSSERSSLSGLRNCDGGHGSWWRLI